MASTKLAAEAEWKTRKVRIDPRLDAAGWPRRNAPPQPTPFRTEEHETANGPADYALWIDNRVVGVVEAKKVTVGPQNVLTQAERYARGIDPAHAVGNWNGLRAPFLYSTNGGVTWFHDVRHPLNRSRRISGSHTTNALREELGRDFEAECDRLLALPHDHPKLRPYQKAANEAVEKAIVDRKRSLLVAMATGTGKTFTLVNQIYRLMKAGVAHRVLFLVDRRALAAQAVRAFSAFEVEPGKKFDQVYEVYSSRFQTEDFGEDEKFDPKLLPQKYLTDPQPGHAFVYVCTIQRMAINLFGRQAIFGAGDEAIDDDADRLDIPIHAFDLIIADECHRGYTSQELSTWRSTLDHFDAIKVGLSATPAGHTAAYFSHKAFEYRRSRRLRSTVFTRSTPPLVARKTRPARRSLSCAHLVCIPRPKSDRTSRDGNDRSRNRVQAPQVCPTADSTHARAGRDRPPRQRPLLPRRHHRAAREGRPARADKLPQAILSKAFSGELVPTEAELARAEGREYETAEQLLARVRGASGEDEQAKRAKAPARRKRQRVTEE